MNIVKPLLIILFLVIAVQVFSQSLTGRVKTKSGKEIPFANLSVDRINMGAVTDEKGNYTLKIPKGTYNLSVSAIGFKTLSQTIVVDGNVTIDFILDESIEQLENVVITGTKTAVTKDYVPFNVSIVEEGAIQRSGESSLLPVIEQQVPGLFVTKRGVLGYGVSTGSAGTVSMRGLAGSPNTRVLFLVNGNPHFAGIFGHSLPDSYVSSDIERVEVIHGASSVLYGTNAMGGIINIITKKQKQDGYFINGSLLYGSYDTKKAMSRMGYRKDDLSIVASFNNDRTDGHRTASDFNIRNGFIQLGCKFSDHINIGAEVGVANYDAGDPGPIDGNIGDGIDIRQGVNSFYVNNEYEKTSGKANIFYNYGNNKIEDGFRGKDATFGFSMYQAFKHIKNNTTTIGLDYKHYGGKAENIFAANGAGIVFGDESINEWAPYLFSQQTVGERFILSAGVRLDHHSEYGNIIVPSGGISFMVNDNTTLKASISRGFRSPTIRELYLFPPANIDLEPEKMMNYEATINQSLFNDKLNFEFTAFNVQGDNLIQTVMQDGAPRNVNSGEFNNSGIEVSANFKPQSKFSFSTNYGYTHIKYSVIAAPKHKLNVSSTYQSDKLTLNLNLQTISDLYTQVAPDVKSGYTLLSTKVGYEIHPFVDVFVKGENLTDRDYEINHKYPMPGVMIFGGINFHLQKMSSK